MKRYKKHISKALFCLLTLNIVVFISVLLRQTDETKAYISDKTATCLEHSVKKYSELKTEGVFYYARYEYSPDKPKTGEYETRTVKYADTTFTYQSKIVDPEVDKVRAAQTLLLDIGQLHADSIQIILDSLLQANDIYAQSIIGITASFYTKKNEWTGDTTALSIHHRVALTNQGNYEDINYYAYLHYSPLTIWTLMPKPLIIILFLCCITTGTTLLWWSRKRRKEIAEGIVFLKNGNYRIRNCIYDVGERRLMLEDREMKLPPQLHNLLLMFLNANDHQVNKKEIKQQFWSQSIDATSNMTSTINRLNKVLKEIECRYAIISHPRKEEVYVLGR